jgi:hypothetical protein
MGERTILLHFVAVPLRQKLVAVGIAVAIGSGWFVWSRYSAQPPATTAVLSFDTGAARQADPGVMNANAKEPAVALARSILSDEAVRELAKQAGVPFSSSTSDPEEFRSRLDMAQTSERLLRVNYKDTDKELSAAVANAVANMLVAWIPASVVAADTSAPARPGGLLAKPAFAKSRRQRHPLQSQSNDLLELERQLAVAERKLTALYARAFAAQKSHVAAPSSTTDANETNQLRLERARLIQAILVEKRREAGVRDQTASKGGNSASPAQTVSPPLPGGVPDPQSLNPVGRQIWQRPFTLVRLAGDAGASQSESGLSWYWPLAGILCGLLYLGGAIWRYRPIEQTAPLELPVANNTLTAEKATEFAGSFINTEDRWTKEVLESLSLTGIGHEDEAFATPQRPLAVDRQQQVDRSAQGLLGHSHYDEVLAVVLDKYRGQSK